MGTFADLTEDPRKRKPTVLPLPGARFNAETGKWEGSVLHLDVIALGESEHQDILKDARDHAIKAGIPAPTMDDELYERAVMVFTLVRACLDQAVTDAEKPFFPGGAEQILASRTMTPELVAYLYETQRLHQDELNPLLKDLSPAEFIAGVVSTAGGNPSFFVSSRPGTQWSFVRSLAALRLASMTRESDSGGHTATAHPTTG